MIADIIRKKTEGARAEIRRLEKKVQDLEKQGVEVASKRGVGRGCRKPKNWL